ncbi:MAG: flagellar M-ring protein FliF [Azoarcus sp.]|jgi:flagellar M-ring protein FliF|nr:flagellar M-ring protein FliF [Azoarcus sp.]
MAAAENTVDGITADIVANVPPAPSEAGGTSASHPAFAPGSPRARLQQALANIKALNQRQQIAAAVVLALVISLAVGIMLWSRPPNQAVLFTNFEDQDGGEIINALQQQNVPFSISGDGRSILVPAGIVYETRLRLAAAGLPKGGQVGFELMDTQKIGVSQFNEQVNYQRALEGELARTVQSLASVVAARVHLAMPKQTSFLRDDQKPTASVMVQLRPGRTLNDNQVAGIMHLVSSSVPRMSDSGVSIVDQNGKLLTGEDPARRSELDPSQLLYIEEVETGLIRRIENILTPMFGKNNFRAQVAADIDFNKVEQTAETFRPNPAPEQAIRSQQTNEQQARDEGPQGVPGALTNQPPVPATAPITIPPVPPPGGEQKMLTNNRSAVINYELDRTVQHVKQSLGQIKRLSVAVVINHNAVQLSQLSQSPGEEAQPAQISDDEIARITNLVRDAVGYNTARGDTISVVASPFADTPAGQQLPVWKDPQMIELGLAGGKYLGLLILLLFAYFGIIRPLLRTIAPPPAREESGPAKGKKGRKGETEDEEGGFSKGEKGTAKWGGAGGTEGEEGADVGLSAKALRNNEFEARLERMRQKARENPKSVAELLNQWLGVNEEGGHK